MGTIVLFISMIFMSLILLFELCLSIRCYKIFGKCSDRSCKFHKVCHKYKDMLTAEEAEELIKQLEEFRKK